jgi:hypothetical protein
MTNRTSSYVKHVRNLVLQKDTIGDIRPYRVDLNLGQFGLPARLSLLARLPTLGVPIGNIVQLCSEKKMRRVDASRNIALM